MKSPAFEASHSHSIAVVGLGYVGSVTAACLAHLGHRVCGVDIDPVNLVVKPGTKSLEQVIAGIDNGLMIGRLASADASGITGAFGLEIRCAYVIEKGSIIGTVNHALAAGNMFDALKNVREVANDTTVIRSGILPSVAFEGIEIIGSK